MCGIVGKFNTNPHHPVTNREIDRMLAPIAHRGPDGQGIHLDGSIGLGHRRLSIIDLDGGTQPMPNEDGTVWIVFNGEIYNYKELRTHLTARGHRFNSLSDTEVIIHAYEEYGDKFLKHLRGMFAFAIWDRTHRRLLLARDRVGIKPLYYAATSTGILFASEIKAILADPSVSHSINPQAIRQFLSFTYTAGSITPFQAVQKLPPGHYLVAEANATMVRSYWDLAFSDARHSYSFAQASEELHSLLQNSITEHMIADVPVGILLSGGVDSSAVAAFAVDSAPQPVHSFTVGFDADNVVDERPYARIAASRFNTIHHELTITADDFWSFLPRYAWHMEELVCEPPAIALSYVSRHARDHVKVLLSGEGGDEAFAGYPNYSHALRLRRIEQMLGPMARPVGKVMTLAGEFTSSPQLQRFGSMLGKSLSEYYFSRSAGPRSLFNYHKASLLNSDFLSATAGTSPEAFVAELLRGRAHLSLLDQMLYVDSKTWLPDDLLIKADKMTMANSVELRVPLLDHRILEFASSIPGAFKVHGGQTKRILKHTLSELLPSDIVHRKKAGFPVPYEAWMRGPLSGRIRELLLSAATQREYFNRKAVERLLEQNRKYGSESKAIFSMVILELWYQSISSLGRSSN